MDFSDHMSEENQKEKLERTSIFQPPLIKFGRKSTYQANFTEKPLHVDRKSQPHKPFTVPVEQIEKTSLYQDTFVAKEMDRVKQFLPKSEYEWPNEQYEMKTEHQDNFQEKSINVERKGRKITPYNVPKVKMDTHSTYHSFFSSVKNSSRPDPFLPKSNSWYKMKNENDEKAEKNRELQPIQEQAKKDARTSSFVPKNESLRVNEEISRLTTCRASFVHHGIQERVHLIKPVDNDFTYTMKQHPSESSLDGEP